MKQNPELKPGEESGREHITAARIAALAIALAGFAGHEANASAEPGKFQNPLIQKTDKQLSALADQLQSLGIRSERIKYRSKFEKNASRYAIARPVFGADGRPSFSQLVLTVKDGQSVPVETAIIHGIQRRQYDENEKFPDGVIASRDFNANMYWMERVDNSTDTAISKGMFPLVNLPLEKQDKSLGKAYNDFTQEAADLIDYLEQTSA